MSAPIGVGLLGLGTVGSAVARAMAGRAKRLEAMAGRPVRLVAAAARDATRTRDAAGVAVTTDPFAILDDPAIKIVVEVIGGTSPARDLQLAAFERGKHVVTANKELVAKHWNELHEAARLAKRELRFEASVAAAVPIIAATRQLSASRPRVLRGLLNGPRRSSARSSMPAARSTMRSRKPRASAMRKPTRAPTSTALIRRTSSASSSACSRAGISTRTT